MEVSLLPNPVARRVGNLKLQKEPLAAKHLTKLSNRKKNMRSIFAPRPGSLDKLASEKENILPFSAK